MFKTGDKFTIEIAEVLESTTPHKTDRGHARTKVYKIKGADVYLTEEQIRDIQDKNRLKEEKINSSENFTIENFNEALHAIAESIRQANFEITPPDMTWLPDYRGDIRL